MQLEGGFGRPGASVKQTLYGDQGTQNGKLVGQQVLLHILERLLLGAQMGMGQNSTTSGPQVLVHVSI